MTRRDELSGRAREYARRSGLKIAEELGFGIHGIVFAVESQPETKVSSVQSAVKVHERENDYRRERDTYLRLKEYDVREIRGCEIPQLLRYDDDLLVIEMTVVSRPFILDFAGAYLDHAPDFPEEVLADWRAEKEEQFGSGWPEVQAVLRLLETYGIFLEDVSPGNISFPE
jgi:hypothetical protein